MSSLPCRRRAPAERERRQPESRQPGSYGRLKRALANDVTVCGENEPVAYVTEYFLGDGVTTEFDLADDPYFPAASKCTIIDELFNEAQINATVWGNNGGSGYLTLGRGRADHERRQWDRRPDAAGHGSTRWRWVERFCLRPWA